MVTGEVLSPPRIIYDCTTLVGNDGKLFSIEFLYRSRRQYPRETLDTSSDAIDRCLANARLYSKDTIA